MASTTLKTYGGKSQKSRLDIFDDFFNERPTKKLNPLIAKLKLPEKDGSFLASDSLHVSTEDAFDKLRKGPLLNDVNIVNSFKKLESSDSDFTVPDVGYPDLFPPIQKKSVKVGRFYRKRKVTQDLPNVEKCPEQLNIKKRKFESKFKKPRLVLKDTSNFEIGQEIRPKFCSTPINHKNKSTHQNNSPICVFPKNDTQHTNSNASRSRFSIPDNVTKRSNNSAIKQLNLSDPGIVSKNNTELTTNLLTSLRKSLSEPQSCISLKENSKESVEELCMSENRISESLSGSHENITKRSSNRELKNKYLYVLLKNSPIANNLEKEHGTAKNSIISINNTDLTAESFKLQENALNFPASNDKENVFAVSVQEVQKADKNLYVLSENDTNNKQLDKECNQEITSNSILSIDNIDLNKVCDQEMTKFKKPSILVEDTTNLNFEIGQEIRPTFCSTPINQKNKNTHQNNSPTCVFSKNDTQHTNRKASISRFSTPDNVGKRSNNSVIKQLNLSDPGIVSKNNTDLTTNLLTSLRKSESQSCFISLKENSKELVEELCRSENRISKSLSGSHENITKRSSNRELKNKYLYVLLENSLIDSNLEKEQGTAKNSIISINNTDLTTESFKWQENAPNFQTSNDKGNDFAVSIQEVEKADKNLYVLSENVTNNKQLDKECNQEITSNSILSIDNIDLNKVCDQEMTKFKKPSILVEDTTNLNFEIGQEIRPTFCSTPINQKHKNTHQNNSPICVFSKNDTQHTNSKASRSRFSTPDNVTKRSNNSAIKQLNLSDPGIVSKNNTDLTTNLLTSLRKSVSESQSCFISLKENSKELVEELCRSENTISKSLSGSHENITKRSSNRELKNKYLYVLLENSLIDNNLENEHGTAKNSIISINNTDLTAESFKWQENAPNFQTSNDKGNDFSVSIQEVEKADKNLYVLSENVTSNKQLDNKCNQEMTSNSIFSTDNTDLTAESVNEICSANTSVFLSSNGEKTDFEKSIQEPQKTDKKLYVLLKNVTINTDSDKECDQETTSNSILSTDNTDLTAESVNTSVFLSSNDEKTDFEKSIQEPQTTDKNLYVLLDKVTINKYLDKECDQETTSNSILSPDNTDLTAESVNTSVFLSSNGDKTDFEKSIQEPQTTDKNLYVLLDKVAINKYLGKECDQETTSNSILSTDNTDLTAESVNTSVFLSSNGEKIDFEKSIQEPQTTDKNPYVLLDKLTISKYLDKECVNQSVKNCDQGMFTLSINNKIKETQSSSHTDESVKSDKDNSVFQSTNKISRSLSSSHEHITKRSHNSTNTSAIKCKELCVLLEKKSTNHEQPVINDTANHSVISIQEETNEKKRDSVMSVILEDDECLMPQPIITKKSVRFKPGKSWRRSLSMHQNSIVLDETTHCTCAESSCSCGKCQISRLSRAQIKRCSIRVLPISTEKSSRRTTILQDYAKTSYVPDQDIVDSHLENSVRSLSISSRNTKYKKSVSVVTAKEVVLRRCGQTEPLPFDECYPSSALKNCQKIGEGVYGEVFLYKNQNGQTTVMKVIPIEGDLIINGERQKKFQEILSEVIIAMELSNLRNSKKNSTCGFSEVQKIRCVQGCYPERLLDLWNLYEETKGTENDSPEVFNEDQLYIVLELANGGKDLEAYQFTNAQQAFSMFQQVACSLAVAENQLHFEHRDLHWGNILLSTVDKRDKQTFCLDGRVIEVPTLGVSVAIIDFTLSRIEYDGVVIFNDLSVDPDLFTGEGDYQFEIYRQMQTKNSNKWHLFEPYTNLLWLHYTLDKAITALHYKNTKSKLHKEYLTKMKSIKDYLLNYNSVKEFVLDYFN